MKECKLCGEEFVPYNKNNIYCSDLCKRVAQRRRSGVGMGYTQECVVCGKEFWSKHKRKICSEECRKLQKSQLSGSKTNIGGMIPCKVCGEPVEKRSVNTQMHQYRCKPKDGKLFECLDCGKHKPYGDFYDYRGKYEGGRLCPRCKKCQSKRSMKYQGKVTKYEK